MKVILVNGSPKTNGGTALYLDIAKKALEENGIETEVFQLGSKTVNDCIGCGGCRKAGKCVFEDELVASFTEKAKEADGFIFASPVYYAHPSARILSFMDRVFYSEGKVMSFKPARGVSVSRRAGGVTSMDVFNKYFTINQMPVVSSFYWNEPHGDNPEQVSQDEEGQDTMTALGNNMSWMLKCIDAGKKAGVNHPEFKGRKTNFNR